MAVRKNTKLPKRVSLKDYIIAEKKRVLRRNKGKKIIIK